MAIVPEGFEHAVIRGYRLTVHRGARAGMVRDYSPNQRTRARRFADRLDLEYGAICCGLSPIFGDAAPDYSIGTHERLCSGGAN